MVCNMLYMRDVLAAPLANEKTDLSSESSVTGSSTGNRFFAAVFGSHCYLAASNFFFFTFFTN